MLIIKQINLANQSEGDVSFMYVTLSTVRKEYVDAARVEHTRAERIAGGYLLESFLREHQLSGAIERKESGKPVYVHAPGELPLYLSLSHSYPLVYAAFSDVPVGIDVEAFHTRSIEHIDGIVKSRYLTEKEKQLLLEEKQRNGIPVSGEVSGYEKLFFQIWTCKEAIAKALDQPLTDVLLSYDYTGLTEGRGSLTIRYFEEDGGLVTVGYANRKENR